MENYNYGQATFDQSDAVRTANLLRDKGFSPEQATELLQMMASGEVDSTYPSQALGDAGAKYVSSLIRDTYGQASNNAAQNAGFNRGNVMSQTDGVVIEKSEPDAPGVYISSEQMAQDQYAAAMQSTSRMYPPTAECKCNERAIRRALQQSGAQEQSSLYWFSHVQELFGCAGMVHFTLLLCGMT